METLKEWEHFLNGKKYNNKLDPPYYETVKVNLDFFAGNQWRNLKADGMPTPVFNIIKRSITFFVASLMSSKTKIKYESLTYVDEDGDPNLNGADIATAEVENLFDKFKMTARQRDALFDAAIMGDVAAHIYFDTTKKPYGGTLGDYEGEIELELVDGTNVYLGNPNNHIVSTRTQPYVIISGRDTVKNLKEEAKRHNENDINNINTDNNTDDMAGSQADVEIEGDEYGKAQYIIMYKYYKETDTIKATKCTENAYMFKDVDTGLNHYPIAWLVWEKQKNQYHGRAVCTGIIPNQIFINRMFAMVMYHLMNAAFPKPVYDGSVISNWSNDIGTAIEVDGQNMNGKSMRDIATYLEPGNMSNQIVQVIELAIQYTKETLGINDAMMGNINPEQASGKSIVATVQQASVPLENVRANMYEWVEDIGKILLDMMGTYYGVRDIIISTPQGKQAIRFDFSIFKTMYLNTKCEVGPASYWSELASVETLDNLYSKGALDIIDYLESMPDGYINNKQELIGRVKEKMNQQLNVQANNNPLDTTLTNIDGMPTDMPNVNTNMLETLQSEYVPPEQLLG